MSSLPKASHRPRRRPRRDVGNLTVLITGAARGIGAATAELLARHGARVVLGDLDDDLAQAVADRVQV